MPIQSDNPASSDERLARAVELYRAIDLPVLQNRTFETESEARACARGDVVLVQDLDTGLVYNAAFDCRAFRYDANYQNEQANSAVFQRHLEHAAQVVERRLRGASLIEVGCGKGYFLEQLQARGFAVTGFDPAYEGANPGVRREYFTGSSKLKGDGLILRHVLEHVEDPAGFLHRLRDANGGTGMIYIEVPCFEWICAQRAWFDIFYEHVNYFRLGDFHRMFGAIVESGHFFGGQYLYVVADLATLRTPACTAADRVAFPADFTATIERPAKRLRDNAGKGAAVWGGASKGVIFSLFMQRARAPIDVVIDINPAKQGRYLPATGLRVRSPQEAMAMLAPGADIFVMNGNYLSEIRERTKDRFNYVTVDS